jgi:hypothetical protein
MTGFDRSLGTPVVHRCETVAATGGREVIHVVLPPRRPCATPVSDLRDAGHDVLAYGVLPSELPECPDVDAHPGCEHVLLQK